MSHITDPKTNNLSMTFAYSRVNHSCSGNPFTPYDVLQRYSRFLLPYREGSRPASAGHSGPGTPTEQQQGPGAAKARTVLQLGSDSSQLPS